MPAWRLDPPPREQVAPGEGGPQGLPLFSGLRAAGASAPVWPQAPGARTGGMGRRPAQAWGGRADSMSEATPGRGGDLTCARPQPEVIRAAQVMSHGCRGVFAAGSLGLAEAQLGQRVLP